MNTSTRKKTRSRRRQLVAGLISIAAAFAATTGSLSLAAAPASASAGSITASQPTNAPTEVTLSADYHFPDVGLPSHLVATSTKDVTDTDYVIEIFDRTYGGPPVYFCYKGTTCETTVTDRYCNVHSYVAYVAAYSETEPPRDILATSNVETVQWMCV